jgi:phytoene synthase
MTSRGRKIGLLGLSLLRAGGATLFPQSPVIYARPLPEVAFLVAAAAHPDRTKTAWGESVLSVLSQLEARDRGQESMAGAA